MKTNSCRKRLSVKLTPDEHTAFKKLMNGYDRGEDAEVDLGIQRTTLIRVKKLKRGHEDTITAIRKILNERNLIASQPQNTNHATLGTQAA